MKAKRFEARVKQPPMNVMGKPWFATMDVILATDADRLEAAISRKDEALRRCMGWMAEDPLMPFTTEAQEIYEVAKAALEDA